MVHTGGTHGPSDEPTLEHPKTGIYWLRKRVPEDLRPALGRREEKRSLKTRDAPEAKRRLSEALVELDRRWANLRVGPQTLTEREAHDIVVDVHDRWLGLHRDNPSQQTFWRADLYAELWRTNDADLIGTPLFGAFDKNAVKRVTLEQWCEQSATEILSRRGFVVDDVGHERVAKAFAAAIQRASLSLSQMAQGHFDDGDAVPARVAGNIHSRTLPPLRFDDLVDGWATEKKPVEKTAYEWRRVLKQLAAFLGRDDARRVTPENLIAWKAAMLAAGRRSKTVRDAQIAPVRAVFRWAVENRRLDQNPAERIKVDVKLVPSERKRSYTDDEARVVITAASRQTDPVRRWVPLLCAYSGARVSEVCQLRREDIICIGAIWCLKFDPDAGSLKTVSSERTIPIHAALIQYGFLEFVSTIAAGPIFGGLSPDKFGKRGGNGTKILGRWVRSLGLTDPRLSPNHSWRHRMKTLGRRHGLAPDIIDAITGHGRRSVGDNYGEYEVAAMQRELSKIPKIE